ncbi:MAG: VWA domain-containing protein [Thermoanaerobaculum sp.]|nr:VWA domain-containing protein [Thermoanaerobaculum sp.]MDW7968188.1 VWA domain-containing protein [Thermoanaerobaculum sp.]
MKSTLVLSLMLFATPVLAQEQVPRFISEVTVNNVTVDVVVRDANGVPVNGLRMQDFRLWEDDKEQVITNFLAVEGGQITQANDPQLLGQPMPRLVVLFFDLYLMTEADKRQVLENLADIVGIGLPPGQEVAVLSFDGTLRVHCEPTASLERLQRALKEVSRLPATGLQRQIRLSSFDVRDLPARETWSTYQFRRAQNQEYWFEMRQMVSRLERAFSAALQRYSKVPARKIAVLISPGFPRAENVPIYRDYDFWLDTPPEYRHAGLLGKTALQAAEAEYTLFTLDPSGTQLSTVDASQRSSSLDVGDVGNVAFWREADRKDTLIQAARLTGGEAIFSSDAGAALADVERVTATYYSLAFQPPHAGDGKRHTIRVEVVGHPEYRLTYRREYVDRPLSERDADRIRAGLLLGEQSNDLGLVLVLDKPQSRLRVGAKGLKVHRLNAELRIPYAQLTLLPRGKDHWGQVQVVILVVDKAGNQSELAHQLLPLELPADKVAEARARGYFAYRFTLELEGGEQSLRVAVEDTLAKTTSTVMADLRL